MATEGHLFFHSPCFDGIVSAVLMSDFLEATGRWKRTALHEVNYDARATWLNPLPGPAAVVDFLYHPDAKYWADHHATTFLDEGLRKSLARRRSKLLAYDSRAPSCAGLLWRRLYSAFGYRNRRFSSMIKWADKIDSAAYESVDEAMFSTKPAIRIAASLSASVPGGYTQKLVTLLRHKSLEQVACDCQVDERFRTVRQLSTSGLSRLRSGARCADGIAVFVVDGDGVVVNRYAPFSLFPNARYSAGIIRQPGESKLTVMRNPWRPFPSVNIGRILQRHGGGGHHRVGSVVFKELSPRKQLAVLDAVTAELRQADAAERQTRYAPAI